MHSYYYLVIVVIIVFDTWPKFSIVGFIDIMVMLDIRDFLVIICVTVIIVAVH